MDIALELTSGRHFRIAVIGDPAVGKSSMVSQLMFGKPRLQHDVTLLEFHDTSIRVEDTDYTVQIVDTAGQEEYDELRDVVYPSVDSFLMVVAVNDITSLIHVGHHLNMLQRFVDESKRPKVPLVVFAANKDDVVGETRVFGATEMKDMVEANAPMVCGEVFFTSARLGRGVREAFVRTVKQAVMNRQLILQKEQMLSERLQQQQYSPSRSNSGSGISWRHRQRNTSSPESSTITPLSTSGGSAGAGGNTTSGALASARGLVKTMSSGAVNALFVHSRNSSSSSSNNNNNTTPCDGTTTPTPNSPKSPRPRTRFRSEYITISSPIVEEPKAAAQEQKQQQQHHHEEQHPPAPPSQPTNDRNALITSARGDRFERARQSTSDSQLERTIPRTHEMTVAARAGATAAAQSVSAMTNNHCPATTTTRTATAPLTPSPRIASQAPPSTLAAAAASSSSTAVTTISTHRKRVEDELSRIAYATNHEEIMMSNETLSASSPPSHLKRMVQAERIDDGLEYDEDNDGDHNNNGNAHDHDFDGENGQCSFM